MEVQKMYKKIIVLLVGLLLVSALFAEKSLERIANETAAKADSLYEAGQYVKAGQTYEEAVTKLEQAVQEMGIPMDNQKRGLWYRNAYASYAKGQDMENAARVLGERIKLDPDNYNLVEVRAYIYKKYLDNIPKAIEILEEYNQRRRTFEVEEKIANYYIDANDLENALKWYQKAYELKKDSQVIKNIATIYVKLGNNQKAIQAYEDFLETNPSETVLAKTYKNMGALYDDIKESEQANKYYEKSLELQYNRNIALLLLSKYYDDQQYQKAREKAELLLSKNAADNDALYYRAMINYDIGSKQQAKADFEKIKSNPKYSQIAKGYIDSIESE
jgi:tetratricopeptide (TPR) repeat protein